MNKETKRNLEESYKHIKPYISNESTPELFEMCDSCPCFGGSKHNFEACNDKPCFKFWLAFEYLEWYNSY